MKCWPEAGPLAYCGVSADTPDPHAGPAENDSRGATEETNDKEPDYNDNAGMN